MAKKDDLIAAFCMRYSYHSANALFGTLIMRTNLPDKADYDAGELEKLIEELRVSGDKPGPLLDQMREMLEKEKGGAPKKEDKKPEPKKDDEKPEPKKDEKKPEPKKDDKKPEPKKDEKKPEPKKEEKKPEPKKDEKKPEPAKDKGKKK